MEQSNVSQPTRQDYGGNLMLRSAVERQFEILGEALRRLEQHDPALAGKISEHRRINDFRNIIAHGYDGLNDDIIWQAIVEKVPKLLADAKLLLETLDAKR